MPGSTPSFAYIRVSSIRQEVHGASLEAQADAIKAYAHRHSLHITEWFHESQTAAKRGRTEFDRMLKLLRNEEAAAVIVHKIDRSARNLRDWADFAALADAGVAIHFAAEALDLTSRGGRLTADIQAVVAADYIRNLRQETLKGIAARRRQGLLPCRAPVGYLDNGGGQPKTIDPVKGPLVREMFERYATGRYTLETICAVMNERGLTNVFGTPLGKNGASKVLRQPFYTGIVRVGRTGETYEGVHEPLISQKLFRQVQAVLAGATRPKGRRREHLFSRLFRCASCDTTLIAERQKGHVYYRCHTKGCQTKCLREEVIEDHVMESIETFSITEKQRAYLEQELEKIAGGERSRKDERLAVLRLELGKATERTRRLEDLVLDGRFDPERYHEKKSELLAQKKELEEEMAELQRNPHLWQDRVRDYLERAEAAQQSYECALQVEKREMVELFTSNRSVAGNDVVVELSFPFRVLAEGNKRYDGDPSRDVPRTCSQVSRAERCPLDDSVIAALWEWCRKI